MPSLLDDQFRKDIADYINKHQHRLEINSRIFQFLEGQMSQVLLEKLKQDLGESATEALERICTVNYYRKIIDKLSTIYQQGVTRRVVDSENEQDQELVEWYESKLKMNAKMNANNEAFNAYQYSLLHFSLTEPNPITLARDPFMRTIPNHQYLVMNTSKVDPTSADVIILPGEKKDDKKTWQVYTQTEFIVMYSDGEIVLSESEEFENPFQTYPFVYANNSENLVMPLVQDDDLQMAMLIPLLFTDLNYAQKFQAFSMFVGMDIDDQVKIKFSPNHWISLKSDPQGEKPSFDTIKPTVDTDKSIASAMVQLQAWLSSKSIRPGSVGSSPSDATASGISKIIDESDTYESRVKQIEEYKNIEQEFWDKLLKVYHPRWVADGLIENTHLFTPGASVQTFFKTPKPLQTRAEMVQELQAEEQAGYISRLAAMKQLYPDMTEEQILDMIAEIDAEVTFPVSDVGAVDEQDEDLGESIPNIDSIVREIIDNENPNTKLTDASVAQRISERLETEVSSQAVRSSRQRQAIPSSRER